VQAVRELDDEDPDVAGHRDHHLAARVSRLRGIAVLEPCPAWSRRRPARHLVAELAAKLGEGVLGVLDGVVQQRGRRVSRDSCRSSARIVATASGCVMYGSPLLRSWPECLFRGDLVGVFDQPDVGLGMRGPDRLDQRPSTGLRPPRGAPSLASRRRTPAVPADPAARSLAAGRPRMAAAARRAVVLELTVPGFAARALAAPGLAVAAGLTAAGLADRTWRHRGFSCAGVHHSRLTRCMLGRHRAGHHLAGWRLAGWRLPGPVIGADGNAAGQGGGRRHAPQSPPAPLL